MSLTNLKSQNSGLAVSTVSTEKSGTEKYTSSLPQIYQMDMLSEINQYTQMIGTDNALYKNVKKLESKHKKETKQSEKRKATEAPPRPTTTKITQVKTDITKRSTASRSSSHKQTPEVKNTDRNVLNSV